MRFLVSEVSVYPFTGPAVATYPDTSTLKLKLAAGFAGTAAKHDRGPAEFRADVQGYLADEKKSSPRTLP